MKTNPNNLKSNFYFILFIFSRKPWYEVCHHQIHFRSCCGTPSKQYSRKSKLLSTPEHRLETTQSQRNWEEGRQRREGSWGLAMKCVWVREEARPGDEMVILQQAAVEAPRGRWQWRLCRAQMQRKPWILLAKLKKRGPVLIYLPLLPNVEL